jgi:ribosomal protein S15P/S13E
VKYESPITYHSKDMTNVKVFKKVKVRRSKILVPMDRSMKALSLTIQKIWPMLKFLKSRSNFRVKVRR